MNRQNSTIITLALLCFILAICVTLPYFQKSKSISKLSEIDKSEYFCGTSDLIEDNKKNNPSRGESFFKAKCATCHLIQKKSTGPALSGFLHKKGNFDLFDFYLRNSDSVQHVSNKGNNMNSELNFNHNFKELEKQDLKDLKLYILMQE